MWINLLLQIDFNVQYAYYNGPKTLIHMKAVVSNFLLLLMLVPPYLASLSGNNFFKWKQFVILYGCRRHAKS